MRTPLLVTLSFLISLVSAQANAGGCRIEYVTPSKELASFYIANEVQKQIQDLEAQHNARGEELKMVLIARSGLNASGFELINDDPEIPYPKYVNKLTDMASKNLDQLMNSPSWVERAKAKDAGNRLPKKYYSNEQLVYTHLGLYLKKMPSDLPSLEIGENENNWQHVAHLLADCDEASDRYGDSKIFVDSLPKFFWDSKILKAEENGDYESAKYTLVIAPTPEVQENLYQMVHTKFIGTRKALHEPNYNVIAVPYRFNSRGQNRYQLREQNSNQWPLEVLAAALKPLGEVSTRKQAQDVLFETNYRPTLVRPAGFKENMACGNYDGLFNLGLFWDASNIINCDDQVYRHDGILEVITVKSVLAYMDRNQLIAEDGVRVVEVDLNAIKNIDFTGKLVEALRDQKGNVNINVKGQATPTDPNQRNYNDHKRGFDRNKPAYGRR